MNVWKVILATLVIFGTGVVTGMLLVGKLNQTTQQTVVYSVSSTNVTAPAPAPVLWPAAPEHLASSNSTPKTAWNIMRTNFLADISVQLNLSTEQRDHIGHIIAENQKKTKTISDTIAPQLREITKETRTQIMAELTEEQRQKYDQLTKAQQRKLVPKNPKKVPAGKQVTLTNSDSPY